MVDSATRENMSPSFHEEKPTETGDSNIDLEKASPPTKFITATSLDWSGPKDPENPQNWSSYKKLYHILVPTILGVCLICPR